jgi:hypothetical protein
MKLTLTWARCKIEARGDLVVATQSKKKMRWGRLYNLDGDQVPAHGNVLIIRKEFSTGPVTCEAWFMPADLHPVFSDAPCRLWLNDKIFWDPEPIEWDEMKINASVWLAKIPPHYKVYLTDSLWKGLDWFDSLAAS